MEAGKVPIPIVWPHEGSEVYVTGDFSSYSLTLLTGEKEKYCVVWCDPGTCLYRFMVDGSYMFDKSKPTVMSDGVLYNFIEVNELPPTISNLHMLSLEELEKLDSQLFTSPEQELEKKTKKLQAFLLGGVHRKRFLKQKKAAIFIQSRWKAKKQRKRFLKYIGYLKFKGKDLVETGVGTDKVVEIDLEKEKLKETVAQLMEQNEKLQKSYETLKQNMENKRKVPRKADPPLISIKAFMTPSKPLSFREPKVDLTPKSKNAMGKSFKK